MRPIHLFVLVVLLALGACGDDEAATQSCLFTDNAGANLFCYDGLDDGPQITGCGYQTSDAGTSGSVSYTGTLVPECPPGGTPCPDALDGAHVVAYGSVACDTLD